MGNFSAYPGMIMKEAYRSEEGTSDNTVPLGLQFKLKMN